MPNVIGLLKVTYQLQDESQFSNTSANCYQKITNKMKTFGKLDIKSDLFWTLCHFKEWNLFLLAQRCHCQRLFDFQRIRVKSNRASLHWEMNSLFVKINPVMMLSSCISTATRMLSMLSYKQTTRKRSYVSHM